MRKQQSQQYLSKTGQNLIDTQVGVANIGALSPDERNELRLLVQSEYSVNNKETLPIDKSNVIDHHNVNKANSKLLLYEKLNIQKSRSMVSIPHYTQEYEED